MNPEASIKRTRSERQRITAVLDYNFAQLEYHCRRLHPKVMQVDGEMADDGALIIRATTFVDWPPRPEQQNPWGQPFGPVRVWGTLQNGVFFLHGYDAVTHVVQPQRMKIRFEEIEGMGRKGRPGHLPDPGLIENILQWMRGRLRSGASHEDLTEEAYVLYRWPDRYESEDRRLEGEYELARAILAQTPKRKRNPESGARRLRKHLSGLYTWQKLKQLACDNH
jgi:hypothetical protein